MRGRVAVFSAPCLLALACQPDAAKSVKIVAPPPAPPAAQAELPPFRPELCALPPEDAVGKSKFIANGPCEFHHEGDTKCLGRTDDFHVMMLRKGPGPQATVSVYINVEYYKGPGNYTNAQMFVDYQNGNAYYYWSSDSVRIVVTKGEKSVILPPTRLPAEPPNTGTEIVQGTLWCGAKLDSAGLTNPKG